MTRQVRLSRRGYALLMTLFFIALAALATVSLARRSATAAIDAARMREDVQRRWALDSIEEMLERIGPDLLGQRGTASSIEVQFTLGSVKVRARHQDEQSRINVNVLVDRLGREGAEEKLRTMLPPQVAMHIQLQPIDQVLCGRVGVQPFPFYDRVLSMPRRARQSIEQVSDWLTCWGSGQVHLRRADERIIRLACEDFLDARVIEDLIANRDAEPGITPGDLAALLQLSPGQSAKLQQRLTQHSACRSIWLSVETDATVERRLTILNPLTPGGEQRLRFAWSEPQ